MPKGGPGGFSAGWKGHWRPRRSRGPPEAHHGRTAEPPVEAAPLSPRRTAAPAVPAVVFVTSSTVYGISGVVLLTPARVGDFGPHSSCLRFIRAVARPAQALVPATEWLARPRWDSSPSRRQSGSPTGKRRLCQAQTTLVASVTGLIRLRPQVDMPDSVPFHRKNLEASSLPKLTKLEI